MVLIVEMERGERVSKPTSPQSGNENQRSASLWYLLVVEVDVIRKRVYPNVRKKGSYC